MIENEANPRCSGVYRNIDYTSRTCFTKIDHDGGQATSSMECLWYFSHIVNFKVYIYTNPVYSNLVRYKPFVFIN